MYGFIDYARGGLFCLNNFLRPRHKKLSQLMIYATTRCQSHCRHCNIWQKPHADLPLAVIKELMASRCVTRETTVGLEGGEFVLHPEAEAILRFFADTHPNFTLLTNGLAAERVIDFSMRYKPRRVYVSLDGDRDTYRVMRGCDGYYRAIRVVRALKDHIPVSLMFCLSPWNSFRDMEFVVRLAQRLDVDVRIGIYGEMAFFDTTRALLSPDGFANIPPCVRETTENVDFVMLYDEWRRGTLRLRCHSILNQLVIHTNGDVPLCQNLAVKLGNIYRQSLDEIFNGAESCRRQCRYTRCNACWINFHRKFDIIMLRTLERLLPKRLIERVYGPYQWAEDASLTYKKKMYEALHS